MPSIEPSSLVDAIDQLLAKMGQPSTVNPTLSATSRCRVPGSETTHEIVSKKEDPPSQTTTTLPFIHKTKVQEVKAEAELFENKSQTTTITLPYLQSPKAQGEREVLEKKSPSSSGGTDIRVNLLENKSPSTTTAPFMQRKNMQAALEQKRAHQPGESLLVLNKRRHPKTCQAVKESGLDSKEVDKERQKWIASPSTRSRRGGASVLEFSIVEAAAGSNKPTEVKAATPKKNNEKLSNDSRRQKKPDWRPAASNTIKSHKEAQIATRKATPMKKRLKAKNGEMNSRNRKLVANKKISSPVHKRPPRLYDNNAEGVKKRIKPQLVKVKQKKKIEAAPAVDFNRPINPNPERMKEWTANIDTEQIRNEYYRARYNEARIQESYHQQTRGFRGRGRGRGGRGGRRICFRWRNGNCSFGANCHFAHSIFD